MKYRVRWTENVGYYADIEAKSSKDALEIFEQGADNWAPEPCGYCVVEADSIEVESIEQDEQPSEE